MIPLSSTDILPLETDADGVVRVGETRVTLDTIIMAFTEGATAEEIAQQYSSLQLADVYSVIGYYVRQRAQQADQVRQHNEARFDPRGVRDRLLARRSSQHP